MQTPLLYQQFFPAAAFCKILYRFITLLEQSLQVFCQIEVIEPLAEYAIWRFKMKKIDQDGAVITGFEIMLMLHHLQGPFRLFVNKHFGFFHFRYFDPPQPALKKMLCPPCDRFIFLDQSESYPRHGFFFKCRHGFLMQVNMTAKVKYDLCRCGNKRCKMDRWHD